MQERDEFAQEPIGEKLLPEVRRVMQVQEVTSGEAGSQLRAQFLGRLIVPSDQAYQRLEPAFERESLMLLLREHEGGQAILGVQDSRTVPKPRLWLNLLLLTLTGLSVLYAGISYAASYIGVTGIEEPVQLIRSSLPLGALYAASLLGILVAHEFGHYLAGKYHGTPVSLPFFLPLPGSLFGTLGAFISLRSPPRNRKALFEIGLAGPLAGLVIAIPVLLIGLALSEVVALPTRPSELAGTMLEGNSILYLGIKYLVKGQLLPAPRSMQGVPPLLYWLRYMLLGTPAPIGGLDVNLHPMAWAGWAGFLVTGLNLIPVGQLDGGHAAYSLLGSKARSIWPVALLALLGLGFVWNGWFLFAALIFLLGRTHARPLDDLTPLDQPHRLLAWFGLALFVLLFTPVPLKLLGA